MGVLEDMQVFVRSVEKGSFSAAARDLRLSAAVVSHRMISLEERLGVRLFNRTTRRMQLTSSGRVYYERAIDVIDAAGRAEASIAEVGGAPRGTLKVTAPLGLGRRLLAPMVIRFQQVHPEIDIRARLSEHLLDLVGEGVDVALRMATFTDSSFILRRITSIERVLCASPAYLDAHGRPETPQDLLQHRCLLLRFPGTQQFRWTLMSGENELTLPVHGPIDADDGDVISTWALEGMGIALKPLFEVAGAIAEGKLEVILPETPPSPVTLGVLYLSRQLVAPRIKNFSEMLVEEARRYVAGELAKVGEQMVIA